MTKKLLSIITLLLLTTPALFAKSIGFTSVHSGFDWWFGAISISILPITFILSQIENIDEGEITMGIIIACISSIPGFWVIPSVWCGFISQIVVFIIFLSILYCLIRDPSSWIISSLICALTIAAEVFVMIYLPNNWWLGKYISVAVLGSGIANILALDSDYFEERKATLIGTILLIVDFIAFWIVFGICRWNVASVILGIIFCLLVFVSLISPFICMIIKKVQKDMKESEECRAILEQVKYLSLEISKNSNFVELHPEYKKFYKY